MWGILGEREREREAGMVIDCQRRRPCLMKISSDTYIHVYWKVFIIISISHVARGRHGWISPYKRFLLLKKRQLALSHTWPFYENLSNAHLHKVASDVQTQGVWSQISPVGFWDKAYTSSRSIGLLLLYPRWRMQLMQKPKRISRCRSHQRLQPEACVLD